MKGTLLIKQNEVRELTEQESKLLEGGVAPGGCFPPFPFPKPFPFPFPEPFPRPHLGPVLY